MAINDEMKERLQKEMTISAQYNLWDSDTGMSVRPGLVKRTNRCCIKSIWYFLQVIVFCYECFYFYFFGLIGYVYAYHELLSDSSWTWSIG